jgi:hypothetical protein
MAKTKKDQVVNIDGKEYKESDLTEEQIVLVNHVADLDNKLRSARFNLDQLTGGRAFFMGKLKETL